MMKKSYLLLSLVILNSNVNGDNSSEDGAFMANTEKKDNMSGVVLTAAFIYVILKLEGNS